MITLAEFKQSIDQRIAEFEKMWLYNHCINPEHYPLLLPDNAGVLMECFICFLDDKQESNPPSHPKHPDNHIGNPDSVAFFVASLFRDASAFEQDWLMHHKQQPDEYPLVLHDHLWMEFFVYFAGENQHQEISVVPS